jgi:hypothetical protein
MNAERYEPINCLNIFRGIARPGIPYQITPYRFTRKSGETFKIAEIRHHTTSRAGRGKHFDYTIRTRENRYFRILFDTNTFTWRLLEEIEEGRALPDRRQQ